MSPLSRILPILLVVLLSLSTLAAEGLPTIDYTLNKPGKVSIAIYAPDGTIVRQLLMGAERTAGKHTETWDGLDEKGNVARPGQYTYKMLTSDGLKAEWLMTLGNRLTPAWQRMPGNYVGCEAVCFDEEGQLYVTGACSEGCPSVIRVSPAGKVAWESDQLFTGNVGCGTGVIGGKLYTMESMGKVVATDTKTGQGLWVVDNGWNTANDGWGPGRDVMRLATGHGQVVACNRTLNKVRWLDPADGKTLDEIDMQAPQDIGFDAAGNLLVLSGTSLFRLNRTQRTPQPVLTGLTAPYRFAYEPVSGQYLVYAAGEYKQVMCYAADGTLLATYGRKGGREYGAYHPEDFKAVTDLKADGQGGFLLVETSPSRRIAFFDKSGKLTKEWYGGLGYSNAGQLDPDDPSVAWMYWNGMSGDIVKVKIDYRKRDWRILEVYPCNFSNVCFLVRRVNGRTYICTQNSQVYVLLVDEQAHMLRPLAQGENNIAFFWHERIKNQELVTALYGGPVPAGVDVRNFNKAPDYKRKQSYLWTDANGDGIKQPEEYLFTPSYMKTPQNTCVYWVDRNLNYYAIDEQPMKLACTGISKDGVPQYGGWEKWTPAGEKVTGVNPANVMWFHGRGICADGADALYGFFNSTDSPFGKGFYASAMGGNYIVRWDAKTGKQRWITGHRSPDLSAAPGEARYFRVMGGLVHGCVVAVDWEQYYEKKNLTYVWDPDGLWVGGLLETPNMQLAPMEAYTLSLENWEGKAFEITRKYQAPGLKPGEVIFIGSRINDTPVYKITGFDSIRKSGGMVALTEEQLPLAQVEAQKRIVARAAQGRRLTGEARVAAATLPRFVTPPTIDGKIDDPIWKTGGHIVGLNKLEDDDAVIDPAIQTEAWVGYDDKHLYLAVKANEPLMDKVRAACRLATDPLYRDDSVEIFIDRSRKSGRHNQLVVNSAGAYSICTTFVADTTKKLSAIGATHDAKGYYLELAIPWDQLNGDPTALQPGEELRFNLCRNRHTTGTHELFTWSYLRGQGFHNPPLFGLLYAGNTLPRDKAAVLDGRAWVRDLRAQNIAIDGNLAEWKDQRPLLIKDGTDIAARVYLGWKADGLYAAYDVTTKSPWKNKAAFDMAFNGGAAVDLLIGPLEPKRKEPAPGDVRYLAAPLQDKAAVVEFQPKLSADQTVADKAPRQYQTAAQGMRDFDRVALLTGANPVAVQLKPNNAGYTLEMRVPLHAPLKLESGQRFKLDASVILANAAGTIAEKRLLWFSADSADMFVAMDTVVESGLRPANWGEAELE